MAAGCGDDGDESGSAGGGEGGTVALFLPENKTARYESHDHAGVEQELRRRCPKCKLLYFNAGQDPARQQQQVEAAITQGAKVLVLDPVDLKAAGALVQRAKQADLPVIAYERLIPDADIDYYLSYDNCRVGELQAEALIDRLERNGRGDGTIVKINGSPTDNNALDFKRCSNRAFEQSDVRIGREYDTPDWSPDQAQRETEQAITALGAKRIDGVYAANDGTAGGAIAAMRSASLDPGEVPVTGQDAELAALQRVLDGTQFMTIYKAIRPESEISARVAVALLRGEQPPSDAVNRQVDNGAKWVPSMIFDPVVVTRDNVEETVLADRFWPVEELCDGSYAKVCKQAGIEGGS